LKVATNEFMPMCARRGRYCGVTIAGEVHKIPIGADAKKVDVLRPARRLAYERHALALCERIDRTRLTGVRASRKGHFRTMRRQQVTGVRDRSDELDIA